MTGAEVVTAALEHWLNIGGENVDNPAFRARAELHGNRRLKRFFRFRPWKARYRSATVIVDETGAGDLPADYKTMRAQAEVHLVSPKLPLTYLEPNRLVQWRRVEHGTTLIPAYWSVFDGEDDGTRYLQVHPPPPVGQTVDLIIDYERRAPEFVDTATPPSGMEAIPEDYHDVILEGVIAGLMFDEGDAREPAQERKFLEGMVDAWREEQENVMRQAGTPYGSWR